MPVFDCERKVQEQTCEDPYRLHVKNVEGPVGEQIEQAGGARFVVDHQIITADGGVYEINDDHIDVHPDRDPENGFPSRAESLNNCHVNSRGDDQPVREEGLEEAEVRETVDSQVWCKQGLYRAADAEKVNKLVDRVILCDEHQRAGPHQQTAQVKRQHGLDRPLTDGVFPRVPGDLVDQKYQCQCPTDFGFGRLTCILETEQEEI